VILVTHHIHFAVDSDNLIVMHDNEIRASGEPWEVISGLGAEFTSYIELSNASSRKSLITSLDQLKNLKFTKILSTISDKMSQV
jgi:energy-coupling factor transporter ATP-binding protein EcfA2